MSDLRLRKIAEHPVPTLISAPTTHQPISPSRVRCRGHGSRFGQVQTYAAPRSIGLSLLPSSRTFELTWLLPLPSQWLESMFLARGGSASPGDEHEVVSVGGEWDDARRNVEAGSGSSI